MGFHSEFRSVIGPKEGHMTFLENKPPQTTIKITMNYQTNGYKPTQTTTKVSIWVNISINFQQIRTKPS